jgi:hypothetical protein
MDKLPSGSIRHLKQLLPIKTLSEKPARATPDPAHR